MIDKDIFEAECRSVWAKALIEMVSTGKEWIAAIAMADVCLLEYRIKFGSQVEKLVAGSVTEPAAAKPAGDELPEWMGKIGPGMYSAQDPDGRVWAAPQPLYFTQSGWVRENDEAGMEYPIKMVGEFPLRQDHASTCWYKDANGKVTKTVTEPPKSGE